MPIEIRKQVYEKAIEVIESKSLFSQSGFNHLCFTLPCILYKSEHWANVSYMEPEHNAFPELNKERIERIENSGFRKNKRNEFRKQILQEMLNELNNK